MSTSSTEAEEESLETGGEEIQQESSCHPTSDGEDDLEAKDAELSAKFEAFRTPPWEFEYLGAQADPTYGEESIYNVAFSNPGNIANRARAWEYDWKKHQSRNEGWVWQEIDNMLQITLDDINEDLFGEIMRRLREESEERRDDERRMAEEEEAERLAEAEENLQRQAIVRKKTKGEQVTEEKAPATADEVNETSSNARVWERQSE